MVDPSKYVPEWHRQRLATGWWHSFELPDGSVIEGVMDVAGLRRRLEQFSIPPDLSGKRVLDIGAWDGWFSFEMERRGAEVVAIDNWDNPRFREVHHLLGSRVDYRVMDVYEVTPERLGRFDIVLFLGVLYHLKHPLLGLERVCAVTTDIAYVESFVLQNEDRPVMEFYETSELGDQLDNWVAPSTSCLVAFCRTAGFARVEVNGVHDYGAAVTCYRRWEPPPSEAGPGPLLLAAAHGRNFGVNFRSQSDDCVTSVFRCSAESLGREDVKAEVAGFGAMPIYVARLDGGDWQANFQLPPGLPPGWHDVRLRLAGTTFSTSIPVAVDLPLSVEALAVRGVQDVGGGFLTLWVEGLPANADCHNVEVLLGGECQVTTYVGGSQVNVQRKGEVQPGPHAVVVRCGGVESAPVDFAVTGT